MSSLAKAAVAGDEAARDMFMWRKGSSKLSSAAASEYNFFYGTTEGEKTPAQEAPVGYCCTLL